MGLICKSKKAQDMVDEFESFATLLQLTSDDTIYDYSINGKIMDRTYKAILRLPKKSAVKDIWYLGKNIELHINEYKGHFYSAELYIVIENIQKKDIKKNLLKMNIATYTIDYYGRLKIMITEAEQISNIIVFFKDGLGL